MEASTEIAPSGAAPAEGMARVLAWCAAQRFTGVLTYEHDDGSEVLPLRAGDVDAELDAGSDAVYDRVHDARGGRYTLTEALPPLDGARAEHPLRREGSLGPATLADLLRWCEDVALSGTVHLSVERPTARTHVFRYEHGELAAVELEAWDPDDIGPVFALAEGRFVVRMRSRFGERTPSLAPVDDAARARLDVLRAVRHGLSDLLARRDAAASGRWRRVSVRPPAPIARPASIPAPPRAPKPAPSAGSVVVYYLDHRPAAARTAASSDRTERLAPLSVPSRPRPRPAVIALTVLGVVCAVIAGFGLAAGMELILG